MHTVLSRDGTDPQEFRNIALSQLKRYPSIQMQMSSVVSVSRNEATSGYTDFKTIDGENNTYIGRKLVLVPGTEDLLPDNILGYN